MTTSLSPSVGSGAGERGAVDTRQCAQRQLRHRHQRAGVAGGHRGPRAPLLHQVDRDAHRRLLRAANRLARLFAGVDDFCGVDDLAMLAERLGWLFSPCGDSRSRRRRAGIASPRSDGARAPRQQASPPTPRRRPSHRRRSWSCRSWFSGFRGWRGSALDRDDLATVVIGRTSRKDYAGASVRRSSGTPERPRSSASRGHGACRAWRAKSFSWGRPFRHLVLSTIGLDKPGRTPRQPMAKPIDRAEHEAAGRIAKARPIAKFRSRCKLRRGMADGDAAPGCRQRQLQAADHKPITTRGVPCQ